NAAGRPRGADEPRRALIASSRTSCRHDRRQDVLTHILGVSKAIHWPAAAPDSPSRATPSAAMITPSMSLPIASPSLPLLRPSYRCPEQVPDLPVSAFDHSCA